MRYVITIVATVLLLVCGLAAYIAPLAPAKGEKWAANHPSRELTELIEFVEEELNSIEEDDPHWYAKVQACRVKIIATKSH